MTMVTNRGIKILLACLFFVAFLNLANNYFNLFYSAKKGLFRGRLHIEPRPFKLSASPINEARNGRNLPDNTGMQPCPEPPLDLGPIEYNPWQNTSHLTENDPYSVFLYGGRNKLVTCSPNERAAVIVPIASSKAISSAFISHMHLFLKKQLVQSQLFIVQQSEGIFDPGRLFLAATTEISRIREMKDEYNCFILHNPNFVPVDTRNRYRCGPNPKQLVTAIQDAKNNVTSYEVLGGAMAFSYEQTMKINELTDKMDDGWDYTDMAEKLLTANYTIERASPEFGVYIEILDKIPVAAENATESEQHSAVSLSDSEVLDTHYSVISYHLLRDYTYFKIQLPDFQTVTEDSTPIVTINV